MLLLKVLPKALKFLNNVALKKKTSRSWENFLTKLPSNNDGDKNIVSFSGAMIKDL